jgi:hypothetical protein
MREIELTFFKPSGKYYITEPFNIPSAVTGWEIPDYVRDNCHRCVDMHVLICDSDWCPHLLQVHARWGCADYKRAIKDLLSRFGTDEFKLAGGTINSEDGVFYLHNEVTHENYTYSSAEIDVIERESDKKLKLCSIYKKLLEIINGPEE